MTSFGSSSLSASSISSRPSLSSGSMKGSPSARKDIGFVAGDQRATLVQAVVFQAHPFLLRQRLELFDLSGGAVAKRRAAPKCLRSEMRTCSPSVDGALGVLTTFGASATIARSATSSQPRRKSPAMVTRLSSGRSYGPSPWRARAGRRRGADGADPIRPSRWGGSAGSWSAAPRRVPSPS